MPERENQSLVPSILAGGTLEGISWEGISKLPHLQRVGGLVYTLVLAKAASYESAMQALEEGAEKVRVSLVNNGIVDSDKSGMSLDDLLTHDRDLVKKFLGDLKKTREDVPLLLTGKLKELGLPFGFDEGLTYAILALANGVDESQVGEDEIDNPGEDPLDPTEKVDNILLDMFYFGGHYTSVSELGRIFPASAQKEMSEYFERKRARRNVEHPVIAEQ